MFAAKAQNLAFHGDDFDAQKIVGGQAVFQAMHPTRIFCHIPANRTGDLAGRVRRVIETVCLHRIGYGKVGDPRLRNYTAVFIVDFKNPVELAQPQQHRIGQWQRAA